MARPGGAGAGQEEPLHRGGDRRAGGVRRLARPGPGDSHPGGCTTPVDISDEDLARGGELFRTNCSACHNFEGAGGALPGGKYAPSLKGVSNKHLYQAMLTGPQQMPVFSDEVLRPEDKRAIIGYLNELHDRPSDGGLALGGLGPVSEGLWAWILGLGSVDVLCHLDRGEGSEGQMSTTQNESGSRATTLVELATRDDPDGSRSATRDTRSTCPG